MKTSKWVWTIAVSTALITLNACDNDDDDKASLGTTDSNFVTNASMANYTEVKFGEVAASKGNSEMVRDFGQHMVDEHTIALGELKDIADDFRNANISENMDTQHQQMLQQLMNMSGHAFDSMYIATQVADHQTAKTLFQTEANSGTQKRLKSYAGKYLPHIEQHLQKADSIKTVLTTAGAQGD